jgi:DNA primase
MIVIAGGSLLDVIDVPLRRVASTRGAEYAGPCPWCGGRDRFRVWPDTDHPGYWCRQCGHHGDAIQFLRDRYGLTYREACTRLNLPATLSRTACAITPPATPAPPGSIWQVRAFEIIEASARRLWSPVGARALAYLRRRGLIDATIREARLGYHPCEVRDAPERWGLPADHRAVWLPKGLTLPVQPEGKTWMLWLRRPAGAPKYVAVTGSRHYDGGLDAVRPGEPAMLVEGLLDQLAIEQEGDVRIASVAVGTHHGLPRTVARLALAHPVLVALDADEAGDAAATWWLKVFPQARRWRPTRKDPAAMLQEGADLRSWIREGLGS